MFQGVHVTDFEDHAQNLVEDHTSLNEKDKLVCSIDEEGNNDTKDNKDSTTDMEEEIHDESTEMIVTPIRTSILVSVSNIIKTTY